MTPERFRQIEDVYHEALARPPEERASFLSTTCGGDEALRGEVESLIASHDTSNGFIERPAFELGLRLMAGSGDALIGRELGPYKILSFIESGGMGAVYAAYHTRLERKVALKSLYPSTWADAGQARRVWHEARAASAIVHPSVAQIYEVYEEGEHHFIVMEYVDGVTLRQRLADGPIPLTEALNIAVQIASALIAAHAAGVIHRDIKPANVMLLPDGYVKVLDFGLAKRIQGLNPLTSWDSASTASLFGTSERVIAGTLPYMSPEQLRGLTPDARTDVWGLGTVLYETVTGRAPFGGETQSDIIAAILERTPPPLATHTPDAPTELQRIVDKALAKETEGRYASAREMNADLKALWEELLFTSKRPAAHRDAPPTASAVTHPRRRLYALLVAAIVLAALIVAWRILLKRPVEHFLPGQFEVSNFSENGRVFDAAIAPDGKFVVFTTDEDGSQKLWMKQLANADRIALPQQVQGGYRGLTVSRDGNYVYYSLFREAPQGELYRVSIPAATDTRKLLDDVDPPIALSPDGRRLAFVRENQERPNQLMTADADGRNLTALIAESRLVPGGVAWSPKGDVLACSVRIREGGQDYVSIAGFSALDGTPSVLTKHRWKNVKRIAWMGDMSGLALIATDEKSQVAQIWYVSYPGGLAHRVTTDIAEYQSLSVTDDASTIAAVQSMRSSRVMIGVGPSAGASDVAASSGRDEGSYGVAWTPDSRLVYTSSAGGSRELWVMNQDGSGQRRLTQGDNGDRNPAVTPDGRYILFASNREGGSKIWRAGIDGSDPAPLTGGPDDSFPSISPDGRWVIYSARVGDRKTLWRVSVEGGEPTRLTSHLSNWPSVSPDGKYIACLYREDDGTAPIKLALMPFDGGEPLRLFDLPKGLAIPPDLTPAGFRWSPDGRAILYVNTVNGASNIWSQPVNGDPTRQLTSFTAGRIFWFDISRTNGSLAYAQGQYSHDVVLIREQKNNQQ